MVASAIRFSAYVFVSVFGLFAAATTGLGLVYDETQRCEEGSIVALSGCREGGEPVTYDPLAQWGMEWIGKGPEREPAFEYKTSYDP
jgi:hypothetical protein